MPEIDFFTRAQAVRQLSKNRFNIFEDLMGIMYPELRELIFARDISSAAIYSYYLTLRTEDSFARELIIPGLKKKSLIYRQSEGGQGKITGEIQRLAGAVYPKLINVRIPPSLGKSNNILEALFRALNNQTSVNYLRTLEVSLDILNTLEPQDYEHQGDTYYSNYWARAH